MEELVFNVMPEPDGGFCAKAEGEGVYTQADSWNELCYMAVDATRAYFHDSAPPKRIRLVLIRNEVLAID